MRTLNLGIVAHVDAGKTSLTERLLFYAGAIQKMGRVDQGNTQTDSMELERQRGITIQSTLVSFRLGAVNINLLDTPGHSDFIAEVERALKVLDGAILVISAVEGIQTQTRILMHTLKRLNIPTLIFVNKVDRKGAQCEELVEAIIDKLSSGGVAMSFVRNLGNPAAAVSPLSLGFELAPLIAQGTCHPIFFGSALTGVGISELVQGIENLLPSVVPNFQGPLGGGIFKIERNEKGEKISYLRLSSGQIHVRDSLTLFRRTLSGECISYQEKVTALISSGTIVKIWGLKRARIGDQLEPPKDPMNSYLFSPPTLETVIYPQQAHQAPALFVALQVMENQDPLINARMDPVSQEITVSLYGEVQKEVIQARLFQEFHLKVLFKETKTIYIERVLKKAEAVHEISRRGHNEFYATMGLRIEPGEPGAGVSYRLGVEFGSMPKSYHVAVETQVYQTLKQGLFGWEVTDCIVTLIDVGICPLSTACDFRKLTPLLLRQALKQAGTCICEPISSFELEVPSETLSLMVSLLMESSATLKETTLRGETALVEGMIPVNRVHAFEKRLPGLTQGSGVLLTRFAGYRPVKGNPSA